jgi:hypothetical protein
MRTWTPLWSVIVDSSIWTEDDHVMKVFLTMLALKDSDHVYRGTAFHLHQRAHKSEIEVLDALKVLSSPDTKRIEKQPYDGRRIKSVEGGWLILNGEKYREMVRDEMRRARYRRAQQAYRDRKRSLKGTPLTGENDFKRMDRDGEDTSVEPGNRIKV